MSISRPQGLFITFEGIDGAGKTTHLAPLVQAFTAQGRIVTQSREPGGTPLAEQLRTLVLHDKMDALTEALLVFAARRDHVQQVIAPALARGEVVLCDRFADATFAYQGAGRGFDWNTLQELEKMVLAQVEKAEAGQGTLLQPDLTLWFDLPATVATERLAGARLPDKFEAEPTAFFERVREGYARRAAEQPDRFVRVDATQAVESVWQQVMQALQQRGFL
ncbi:MAG: dTMP kinase [Brachymonas sp.]|nr:dTMP kinase [Brachymonas sp.]